MRASSAIFLVLLAGLALGAGANAQPPADPPTIAGLVQDGRVTISADLGLPPGVTSAAQFEVVDVNRDGTALVAQQPVNVGGAYYWSAATGWRAIVDVPFGRRFFPSSITRDGQAVFGVVQDWLSTHPAQWSPTSLELRLLPSAFGQGSAVWSSSDDGNTLFVYVNAQYSERRRPNGEFVRGYVFCCLGSPVMAADGRTVAGVQLLEGSSSRVRAVRVDEDGTTSVIGNDLVPAVISADGQRVVGLTSPSVFPTTFWEWTPSGGVVTLPSSFFPIWDTRVIGSSNGLAAITQGSSGGGYWSAGTRRFVRLDELIHAFGSRPLSPNAYSRVDAQPSLSGNGRMLASVGIPAGSGLRFISLPDPTWLFPLKFESPTARPFGRAPLPLGSFGLTFNVPTLRRAAGPVHINVTARADLGAPNEFITVLFNGQPVGTVFASGARDCPTTPDASPGDDFGQVFISAAEWNAALAASVANGQAPVIALVPSAAVDAFLCDSWARVSVAFAPEKVDCNANGRDDFEEIAEGLTCDRNGNEIPDSCEAVNPCPVDFNRDCVINTDDLSDYVTCFFAEPVCQAADVNADGLVNVDDLSDFITNYFLGQC